MTKKDNQSPEDSKSTENITEENKDLNTLSYEELLQKVTDSQDEVLRSRAELENFKKRTSNEITNASIYPAIIPGQIIGKVMRWNVFQGDA